MREENIYEIIKEKSQETWNNKSEEEKQAHINKIKITKKKRYDQEGFNNSEKAQLTNLKKYKTKFANQKEAIENSIITRKIKEKEYYSTNIIKYEKYIPLFSKDEYFGRSNIYKWKCKSCGNIFESKIRYQVETKEMSPVCRICFPIKRGTSEIEKQMQDWLDKVANVKVERNKRFMSDNKYKYQLDVYIEELKIGIEMDGIYYHCENSAEKGSKYHIDKLNHFKNLGINVINVWDNEWNNKKEIVQSMLKSKLGISDKIFARKCIIKELKFSEVKEFLETTHIQGSVNSSINIGLFYENELVSLMTLGKSRMNKQYEYELLRFCSKLNTTVIGGFSKCLNYFIKTYKPKSLITYCDKRFSTGNVYIKNGFKLLYESSPIIFTLKIIKI